MKKGSNDLFFSLLTDEYKAFGFQKYTKDQFTCTHFNVIYCILLEYSAQIGIVLHNHPFSKRFTVELKEDKIVKTRREKLRFNKSICCFPNTS